MDNRINFDQFTITQINDKDKELLLAYKLVIVPNKSYLQDTRAVTEFKQYTLGNLPKQKVFGALDKCITGAKIDQACYCAFQLLASGQANILWDRLMLYIYKNINIANPNLPSWLLSKDIIWQRISSMREYWKEGILQLRNNQLARNIIAELVTMACLSRKRKLDTLSIKIKETDFIIANFHEKCKVRNNIMIGGLLGPNDPSEIRISANEFCYNLVNKQIQETLYWLHWILYWEKINIKKYKSFTVQARGIEGIQAIDQRDVIWLVWSIIQQIKSRNQLVTVALDTIDSLWKLYLHKWKPSLKAKKMPLIYWAIHILVYPCDWQIAVIEKPDVYIKSVASNNLLFEKMVCQCKSGYGTVTQYGPSLLDVAQPVVGGSGGPKILNDIGANFGLNVIIEDNYKKPSRLKYAVTPNGGDDDEEEYPVTKSSNKKTDTVESAFSESMNKLAIMSKLDAYLLD